MPYKAIAAAASAPGRSGDEGYRSTGEEPETSEELATGDTTWT